MQLLLRLGPHKPHGFRKQGVAVAGFYEFEQAHRFFRDSDTIDVLFGRERFKLRRWGGLLGFIGNLALQFPRLDGIDDSFAIELIHQQGVVIWEGVFHKEEPGIAFGQIVLDIFVTDIPVIIFLRAG